MELVPFDDRDGWIWWDGALVPWRDAKLHVLTHGLHYASAVFEGERAYARQHLPAARPHRPADQLGAASWGSRSRSRPRQIDAACEAVLAANRLTDAYVRPIAWRGSEMLAVAAQRHDDPPGDRCLAVAELFRRRSDGGHPDGDGGVEAALAGDRADAAKATGLYMIGTLSKHQAEQQGYADALMLDWRGRVAEATGANIFFVMDGELHTPDPDCFLDGITRRSVISLARRQQMKVVERPIELSELARATEVFLAGTAAEVTPVREIAGHRYTPARITETLLQEYDALVRQSPAEVAKVVAGLGQQAITRGPVLPAGGFDLATEDNAGCREDEPCPAIQGFPCVPQQNIVDGSGPSPRPSGPALKLRSPWNPSSLGLAHRNIRRHYGGRPRRGTQCPS